MDPGSGSQCPDPASTTNIKCVLWGGPVTAGNAVNTGQYRNKFQVVIAGSTGYVSNSIASVPGYGDAVPLGNAAINAPFDRYGFDSFMGSAIFVGGPFNASLCAQACTEKSNYALAHPPTDGTPVQTCQFFNTYILYINSTTSPANNQGQYCAMYSESWASKYATNNGQWRGYDHFMIQYSFAYSNSTNAGTADPKAAVAQASKDISWATLQPFCSSYLGYTVPLTTTTTATTTTPVTTVLQPYTTTITTTVFQKRDVDPSVTADIPDSILSLMIAPTDAPAEKRDVDPSVTADIPDSILSLMVAPTPVSVEKRALSTPDVLTKYPTGVLSPACSLQATQPPTSTITIVSTITLPETTTTIATAVATSTAVACVHNGHRTFKLAIVAPGTPYDGATINNALANGFYLGISTDSYYSKIAPVVWNFDSTTGFIRDSSPAANWIGWVGSDGGQLIMSNGGFYGKAVCSIDSVTSEVSCTATTSGKTLSSGFYITSNGLLQLALATKSSDPHNVKFQSVPVKLKAIC